MAIATANATSQYRANIGRSPSPHRQLQRQHQQQQQHHGSHQQTTYRQQTSGNSSAAAALATTAAAAAIGPAGTAAQLTQHLHQDPATTTAAAAAAMTRESSISSHASGTLLRHNEYFRSNQSLCSCNNAAVELENNQFLTDVDLLPVPPPPILSLNRKQMQSSSAISAKTSTSASATTANTTTTSTTPKHMTNHNHHHNNNSNNNNNSKHIITSSSFINTTTTPNTTTSSMNHPPPQSVAQHPASTYHKKSATCNSTALNCATKCVFESNIRSATLLNSCTTGGCDAASINSNSTTCGGHHIGNCLPKHRATSSATAAAAATSKSTTTKMTPPPHISSLQRSNSKNRSKFDLIACGLEDADDACVSNGGDNDGSGDTDLESMYVYHNGGSLMHRTDAPPLFGDRNSNKYSTIGPTDQQRFSRNQPYAVSSIQRQQAASNKPFAKTPPLLRQQHTLPNCTGSKYELTRLLSLSDSRRDVACSGQSHPYYSSTNTCSNSNQQHRYTPSCTACSASAAAAAAASASADTSHPNKSHSLNSLLCDDLLMLQSSMPCSTNSLIDLDYPLSTAASIHHPHPHLQNQHQHHNQYHHHHHNQQHAPPPHQTATNTTTATTTVATTPPPPPPPQLSAQHHHHHFACSMAGGGGGDASYPYMQFDTGTGTLNDHHHHHHMMSSGGVGCCDDDAAAAAGGAPSSSGLLDLTNQMAMCDDSFYGSKLWLDLNGIGGIGSIGSIGGGKHHHNHHLPHNHRHPAAAAASTDASAGLGHHHHGVHMYGGSEQQRQQQSNNSIPWRHRQCPSVGSSNSSTTIARWNPTKHWLAVTSILLIVGAVGVAVPLALRVADGASFEERLHVANQLLDAVPLIDGHNDLPWNIRKFLHNQINDFNFDVNLTTVLPWSRSNWSHTDLYRLKKGKVSAQFWAAYVPCDAQHKDAVQLTLEQIDVIIRLTDKYRPKLTMCNSAFDIMEAHKNQQLCSFAGVEGGHSIGGSLSVLRMFYALGVRYMTLTSTCHTTWADSSSADAPKFDTKHGGLTEHGKTIVREMNRIGMIVDLSHVSVMTMRDTLATSEAPVIFSHSSAYALCNSSRNVQDDILRLVAKNRGLVMINLYSMFLTCSENASVHDVVAHINHIRDVAGVDHVGIGAGFDGINHTPVGLEDVSTYPVLFSELLGGGWTADDLTKLAGQNFIRVLAEVEALRDKKKSAGLRPYEDVLSLRTEDPFNCTSS